MLKNNRSYHTDTVGVPNEFNVPTSVVLKKIGFIGAGQMATSLAAGIAESQGRNVEFMISDPADAACESFVAAIGDRSTVKRQSENQQIVSECDIIFLAVKPHFLEAALDNVKFADPLPLLISVVAGVNLFQLARLTGEQTPRIIRVMPNTPCLIGQGASAVAAGEDVDSADVALVMELLQSVGCTVEVADDLMDSVTGLSGSGPAYVFTFIEAMIDGAVLMGMPRAVARQLAIETVIGAASMVKETGEHPAVLRDRVTSPGGTTIEGLKALEEGAFRDSVMSAVRSATERSRDLGD